MNNQIQIDTAVEWTRHILNDNSIELVELIQPLWSGQGYCLRVKSHAYQQQYVAKVIYPNETAAHPRGWSGELAFQRKCRSYEVESQFYTHYQPLVTQAVTASLITQATNGLHRIMVFDDLSIQGYEPADTKLSPDALAPYIDWLASLHADFVQQPLPHLWEQATYWHLRTRPEEWQAMAPSVYRDYAQHIDGYLHNQMFKTLIHGDAKVANFCFNSSTKRVAAVDFQYSGTGIGVQDLAYFLGSCLSEDDLLTYTAPCIERYFTTLRSKLQLKLSEVDIQLLEQQWRSAYNVACADFYRFLLGWKPDHPKVNKALQSRAEKGLQHIQGFTNTGFFTIND